MSEFNDLGAEIRQAHRARRRRPCAPSAATAAKPRSGLAAILKPASEPGAASKRAPLDRQAHGVALRRNRRPLRAAARRRRPCGRSVRCAPARPTTAERSPASAAPGRRSASPRTRRRTTTARGSSRPPSVPMRERTAAGRDRRRRAAARSAAGAVKPPRIARDARHRAVGGQLVAGLAGRGLAGDDRARGLDAP